MIYSRSKTNHGFTLIEVMISMLLATGIAIIVAGSIGMGVNSQKALRFSEDARVLTNDIMSLLSADTGSNPVNSQACANTFAGIDPSSGSTSINRIKDAGGATKYQKTKSYGNNTLTLFDISIGGTGSDLRTNRYYYVPLQTSLNGITQVTVTWRTNSTGAGGMGVQDIIRSFPLQVDISGGNIGTCYVPSGTTAVSSSSGTGVYSAGTYGSLAVWKDTNVLGNNATVIYQNPILNGNIGINISSPANKLEVLGDIRVSTCFRSATSGVYGNCASDAILKKDIRPFTLGLNALLGIPPKLFKFNGLGGEVESEKEQAGVIAQDVEKVAPELVATKMVKLHPEDSQETEIKTVNYSALIYVIVNAIKDLQNLIASDNKEIDQQLAQLTAQNDALEAKNNEAQAVLEQLEKRNQETKALLCARYPSAEICL